MRLTPIILILAVMALMLIFGGRSYRNGAYQVYAYGGGGLALLVLALLLLRQVL